MRKIKSIIVHCLDTRPQWMAGTSCDDKVKEVRRWHKTEPKFDFTDIGYHYLIDRDGAIGVGRPIEIAGAHVKGYNHDSVGVALVGGHGVNANDKFLDNYTSKQESALLELIAQLKGQYDIKERNIRGHNDYTDGKACPGFQVQEWLARDEKEKPKNSDRPRLKESTSLKGNGLNILSGGSIAAFGAFYSGVEQTERYIMLGFGGVLLLVGLVLFRKKLLKLARRHGIR